MKYAINIIQTIPDNIYHIFYKIRRYDFRGVYDIGKLFQPIGVNDACKVKKIINSNEQNYFRPYNARSGHYDFPFKPVLS